MKLALVLSRLFPLAAWPRSGGRRQAAACEGCDQPASDLVEGLCNTCRCW